MDQYCLDIFAMDDGQVAAEPASPPSRARVRIRPSAMNDGVAGKVDAASFDLSAPAVPIHAAVQARVVEDAPAEPQPVATETLPAAETEPFGAWLLGQVRRGDWIDDLAKAARADAGFPKAGSPDDVRARLVAFGVEGDVYEQVDDAERCWLSAGRGRR